MKKLTYISYYIVSIIYILYISILIVKFPEKMANLSFQDIPIYMFLYYSSLYLIQKNIYKKYHSKKNIYTVLSIINIILIVILLVLIFWGSITLQIGKTIIYQYHKI